MQCVKVVVVGDGSVGKTCFLMSYTFKAFPQDYIPTVFDNFNAVVKFEGTSVNLGLWDTAGQADFETLRPLSYKQSDLFLVFFSITSPTSFENIKQKWYPEILHHCPGVPLILVGTKADQRTDPTVLAELKASKKKPVSTKLAKKLAKELGATAYYECSAKEMTGMKEIFDEVIRTVVNTKNHRKRVGKTCWSITCRNKLTIVHRMRCHRCRHWYCQFCIEIWDDGFKACVECIINEREARKKSNVPIPSIKKPTHFNKRGEPDPSSLPTLLPSKPSPSLNSSEQNSGVDLSTPRKEDLEQSVDTYNDSISDEDEDDLEESTTDDPKANKTTKVVGGIRTGNLLLESDSESDIQEEKNSKVYRKSVSLQQVKDKKSHRREKTESDALSSQNFATTAKSKKKKHLKTKSQDHVNEDSGV
eukprot:TRINITY_DN1451_c0_g1_i1.p1 TRINITY_DN1451_c0_g1~~TRINITY_DN1451_c0_g1_i1.p1  ORF type:complete len:418 (+),score=89.71 TRINITY_DN1451_c0_g1_i1:24-1277(+)